MTVNNISPVWLALAFVGVSCLYLFAVGRCFRHGSKASLSTRWLLLPLLGALLVGGGLLFLPVVLSPAIQSYIDAVQAGLRYYAYPPAGFQPAASPVLYSPAWLAIASLLVNAGSHNLPLLIFLFRSLALLAHLANTGLIWAILAITAPAQRLPGTLLYAWNPLVLFELAANGHYDGLVICLFLLALWLYVRQGRVDGQTGQAHGLRHPDAPPVPISLASMWTGTETKFRWPYEISALLLLGLAVAMDWLALLIAPLFLWLMARRQASTLRAIRSFSLRMGLLLVVVALTYLLVLQDGTTFVAIVSTIDLEHLAHSPLLLFTTPLRLLYTWVVGLMHLPPLPEPETPIIPAAAADLSVFAPALFIFILLFFREFGRIRKLEELLTGMCIVMLGFVVLASAKFWPWYLLWVVWMVALRPYDALSKTMLLLSCTVVLFYPLLSLDGTPFAILIPAIIFGIPFVYFVGVRMIAPCWNSKMQARTRSEAA